MTAIAQIAPITMYVVRVLMSRSHTHTAYTMPTQTTKPMTLPSHLSMMPPSLGGFVQSDLGH
jgi:hypothetical protein